MTRRIQRGLGLLVLVAAIAVVVQLPRFSANMSSPQPASPSPEPAIYAGEPALADAARTCDGFSRLYGSGDVIAAFPTTAKQVASWQEHWGAFETEWSGYPADQSATVCYYDGDFGPARGPALPDGGERPNYTRLTLIVKEDGTPVLHAMGHPDVLAVRDPNRSE